jgi:hypothetical protein
MPVTSTYINQSDDENSRSWKVQQPAFQNDGLSCYHTIDHSARMQKTLSQIAPSTLAGKFKKEQFRTQMPDPIQQPLPAAPQRLRIRRQSMRQETAGLMAVLESLLLCQRRRFGKYEQPCVSNYAKPVLVILRRWNFHFRLKMCILIRRRSVN